VLTHLLNELPTSVVTSLLGELPSSVLNGLRLPSTLLHLLG
jgi:hypothetical protein